MDAMAAEVDLSDLVDFLQRALTEMASNRLILKSISVPPSEIVRELVSVLRHSLKSQREQYLLALLCEIDDLHSDADHLERELGREQHRHLRQMRKLATERDELKQRRDYLSDTAESREVDHARKEKQAQVRLKKKENAFTNIYSAVELAEATYERLRSDVGDLRAAVTKMQRVQRRLINQAKEVCTDELYRAVDEMNANRQGFEDRRLAQLRSALAAEKNEQKRLEEACAAVLEGIAGVTSKKLQVSAKEFPHRVDDVVAFVDKVIAEEERKANAELKKQIGREIRDMRFGGRGESAADAVERYIEEKVAEKQSQCEEILRKGAERERKLRQKLDEALTKIQKLQGTVTSDAIEASEIDRKQNSWLEQKRRLDETMAAIQKMRDSSSSFASLTQGSDTD